MKGHELIRKLHDLGKKQGLSVFVNARRGKGSHQTLYFGERLTILRNPADELKTGTLHAMLKQLGLTLKDLEDL